MVLTTGIIYHSERNDYALSTTYDGQISEDAWDNYKYMNMYIQNDFYDDGNGDINTVDFYLDNNFVKSINYGPYEYNYIGLSVGDHTIKVVVTDNGGSTNSAEITITVYKKIYFPEVQWITSNTSYTQNKTEFASSDKTRRIEIRAYTETYTIIVKGPNNFEQTYETTIGEAVIIENIAAGTWTVEIPAVNKKISKTFE